MNCRCPKVLVRTVAGLMLGTLTGPSLAAGAKDKEAKELHNQAIMTDYLAMQFDAAKAKLQKALELCAPDKCSPRVVAEIHRDLAVVYIAGENKIDEGKAEFVSALAADPTIELDKDLATEAVQAAFQEVKAAGGGKKAKKKQKAEKGAEPAAEAASSGDIVHQPPAEGMVMTPLPIYAELVPGVNATKLQVRYKTPTGDWESTDMNKVATGYGAEIPCKAVGSSPHELEYIIQAYDKQDVVAFSGSRTAPHRVPVKAKFEGSPPSLPDKSPPAQCVEECPPGFPGCGAGEGDDCVVPEDCKGGLVCKADKCVREVVDETAGPGKKFWLSLAAQQDFMLFPAENRICSGNNSYHCFFAGGTEYFGKPNPPDFANAIASTGFGIATTRVLAGFDYLLTPWLSLGARAGWAFNGAPKRFMPVHVEARAAWWIIKRSAKPGFRPYIALSGGMAQVDARFSVNILQINDQPNCVNDEGNPVPGGCPATKDRATGKLRAFPVDAWRSSGLFFASLGVGAMYQFAPRWGAFLELKAPFMFPTTSFTPAVVLGASVGLERPGPVGRQACAWRDDRG